MDNAVKIMLIWLNLWPDGVLRSVDAPVNEMQYDLLDMQSFLFSVNEPFLSVHKMIDLVFPLFQFFRIITFM